MAKKPKTKSATVARTADSKLRQSNRRGWLSTDEEERNRRRERGLNESFRIAAVDPAAGFFGTFRVRSEDSTYEVEINSLADESNACNCPDHRINGLGTCKHVEAVLTSFRKRGLSKFEAQRAAGSPNVEIFLDRRDLRVKIRWPQKLTARSALRQRFEPLFSQDGTLLADPAIGIPALNRAIEKLTAQRRRQVRVSSAISVWLRERNLKLSRDAAKAAFLDDVAAGKRSLNLLKSNLLPYQIEGMLHLAFTERALLADEMGLGKTIQAIAACELLRRLRDVARVLVITPASLKSEWQDQIARFSDLPVTPVAGTSAQRIESCRGPGFFFICNYEQIVVDGERIQEVLAPDIVVLDEAQRIKNWQTKTAVAVKRLKSRYAFVLTGTPLENRIDEIFSIVQFLDPAIFGPLFRFNRNFYQLDERGRPIGCKNLDLLHRQLKPVMLRRRKSDVAEQLPGRSDKHYYVAMDLEQRDRYSGFYNQVARMASLAARRPLAREEFQQLQQYLACMRMVCDSVYILDQEVTSSPKLDELDSVLAELLEDRANKIIIFSEWERMLKLTMQRLSERDVEAVLHSGSISQQARRAAIERFSNEPECRLFLSTDSGATGLNLQAANVVINLDLPWNPARLEQRIARAWRKYQKRPVRVLNFVTEDSIESRMIEVLAQKRQLADAVIDSGELQEISFETGQRALISRVRELTGIRAPLPEVEPVAAASDPGERFAGDCVAQFNDRIVRIDHYEQAGRVQIMVVVDALDEGIETDIRALGHAAFPETPLRIIDKSALTLLQELELSGVIEFRQAQRLAGVESSEQAPGRIRFPIDALERALSRIDAGQRALSMAELLLGGGFDAESLGAWESAYAQLHGALANLLGSEEAVEFVDVDALEGIAESGLLPVAAKARFIALPAIKSGWGQSLEPGLVDALDWYFKTLRSAIEQQLH